MCWTCDNPQATEADYEARMWDKIDRFGWAIQYIEPSRTSPPWAYTVGLTLHRKPELVVMGLRAQSRGATAQWDRGPRQCMPNHRSRAARCN